MLPGLPDGKSCRWYYVILNHDFLYSIKFTKDVNYSLYSKIGGYIHCLIETCTSRKRGLPERITHNDDIIFNMKRIVTPYQDVVSYIRGVYNKKYDTCEYGVPRSTKNRVHMLKNTYRYLGGSMVLDPSHIEVIRRMSIEGQFSPFDKDDNTDMITSLLDVDVTQMISELSQ